MNCHESGLINDVEWSVYCDWHSFLVQYLQLQFDGFIYLRSSPEVWLTVPDHFSTMSWLFVIIAILSAFLFLKVAMRRLKKRGRPEVAAAGIIIDWLIFSFIRNVMLH